MKVADFNKDLEQGLQDQIEFEFRSGLNLKISNKLDYDFESEVGLTIELKTDKYDTPNFFFERWSDVYARKPGGPWQSQKKGADVFINWFKSKPNSPFYAFDTNELVAALDQYITTSHPRLIEIKNKNHTSAGYLVPISDFAQLAALNGNCSSKIEVA